METKQTAVEFLLEKWHSNDRMLWYTDFEKALKIEEKQIYDADTIRKEKKKEEKRRKEFSEWFSKAWQASINSPDKHAEDWNY
jgi:hypothetical protein